MKKSLAPKATTQESSLNITSYFNINTEDIRTLIPENLSLFETQVGKTLCFTGITLFEENNFATEELSYEIFWGSLVKSTPEFIKNTNLPMAMYILNLTSTSNNFIHFMHNVTRLPIYEGNNLILRKKNNKIDFEIEDDNGRIMTLRNTNLNPAFLGQEQMVQCFASPDKDNNIFYSEVKMVGNFCTHYEQGDWGKLYNHPFFLGFNVEKIKKPDCSMQVITEPGKTSTAFAEKPSKLAK